MTLERHIVTGKTGPVGPKDLEKFLRRIPTPSRLALEDSQYVGSIQQGETVAALVESKNLRHEKSINNVVSSAMQLGKGLYLHSEHFSVMETTAGLRREQIEKAVMEQDYSGTESLSTEREYLVRSVALSKKTGRAILREVIQGDNSLDFSRVEQTVFFHGLAIADHMDGFRADWMEQVAKNPLVDEFLSKHKGDLKGAKEDLINQSNIPQALKEQVKELNYLYLVFQRDKAGEIKAVPYRTAFTEHYDKIVSSYQKMQQEIMNQPQTTETAKLAEYLGKITLALNYSLNNPVEQNRLFEEAEIAWVNAMNSDTKIFLQHPMEEGYFGKLGVEVEPEFVLGIENAEEQELNLRALQTQERMGASLEQLFPEGTPGRQSFLETKKAMEQSRLRVYVEISGGTHIEFQPLAACLPNREESREAGVNVNVNMETYDQRAEHTKELVKKLFGEKSGEFQEYSDNADRYRSMDVGVFTTGHEIGHVAFIRKDTQARLNQKQFALIEENKADLISIATAPDNLDHNQEDMIRFVKAIAFRSLRNLERVNSQELQPYINGSSMYLSMMDSMGILTQSADGKLHLDVTVEKAQQFIAACQEKLLKVANLYENGNTHTEGHENADDAKQFIDVNYKGSLFIQRLKSTFGHWDENMKDVTIVHAKEILKRAVTEAQWQRAQRLLEEVPPESRSEEFDCVLLSFFILTGIPRASGNENQAANFVQTLGLAYEGQGLVIEGSTKRDSIGNVYFDIPATSSELDTPKTNVVVDTHVDMVPQYSEKQFDPAIAGVTPEVVKHMEAKAQGDPNWWKIQSKNNRSTLGADNGAMASVLAQLPILLQGNPHGKIRVLFTVGEESGLDGAKALGPEVFEGFNFVCNADGESERYPLAGSAAIGDTKITLEVAREVAPSLAYKTLTITGPGGHSGVTIADPLRKNTVKLAAQMLKDFPGVQIASFDADADLLNAIPKSTTITVGIPKGDEDRFANAIEQFKIQPKIEAAVEDAQAPQDVLTAESSKKLLGLLSEIPHGVYNATPDGIQVDQELLSPDSDETHTEFMPVQTATNLARMRADGNKIYIDLMSRSLSNDNLEGMRTIIRTVAQKFTNIPVEESDPEPVWEPDSHSSIFQLLGKIYQEQNPNMPPLEPKATLGGLELGPWAKMAKDLGREMQMISFGPDIHGAHTVNESVSGPSLQRQIQLLTELLSRIAQ